MSQFKKIEQDRRNHGEVRWKHAMHLLLAVKRGVLSWPEVDAWHKELHRDFKHALAETKLPERPDYEVANRYLVTARKRAAFAC